MIPTVTFTESGIVAPTREELSNALGSMFREAFGSGLNPDPRTPQGQLVTSLTAMLENQNNAIIQFCNNFDPRYSFGIFQDALAEIYFIKRRIATRSIVQLEFMGSNGLTVPEGFAVLDDAGNEWQTTEPVTLGAGRATVEAICMTPGEISAAPGTITTFVETMPGLDRVENPAAAAAGQDTENRVNFEDRRYESVAANSKNTNASVFGAVSGIQGVIDCYVIDNPTDSSIVVGTTSYPMIRNSLLVSVVGGDNYEIAKQILIKGGTGCAMVGNTIITYLDTESENPTPPEYQVTFLRPTHVTVHIRLVVVALDDISYANQQKARQHILSGFQNGESRARIGGKVVGANYICGLDLETIKPVKIELSKDGGSTWNDALDFGVDEFPVSSLANITLETL